ncbi:MAG: hypothetical protein CSB33_00155 [Desulfobacterales bacterium]|nr:MAG: hypothetical protein CSB33_00155 [Desulfobacterales bacterium]
MSNEDIFEEEEEVFEEEPEEEEEVFEEEPEEEETVEEEPEKEEEVFEEEPEEEEEVFEEEPEEEILDEEPADVPGEDSAREEVFEEAALHTGDDVYEEEFDVEEYEDVSSQGLMSRLGGALTGVIIGFLIFLIGFPVLFWNEGRTVKRYRTLKQGGGDVVTVAADSVNPANEGKLVHLNAKAETAEILTDHLGKLGEKPVVIPPEKIAALDRSAEGKLVIVRGKAVSAEKLKDPPFVSGYSALVLERRVEIYQWRETRGASKKEKKLGGSLKTTTKYQYEKTWSDELISSAQFENPGGHENPSRIAFASTRITARDAKIGAYALSPDLLSDMTGLKKLNFKKLPGDVEALYPGKVHMKDGAIYIGKNPDRPAVGDMRIRYMSLKSGDLTVMGRLKNGVLMPEQDKNGNALSRVAAGKKSPLEMGAGLSISARALRLRRTVEMYQWKENRKTGTKTGADGKKKKKTTYSYEKVWSSARQDSAGFKKRAGHENPAAFPYESRTVTAKNVTAGAFDLPESWVSGMGGWKKMSAADLKQAMPKGAPDGLILTDEGIFIGKDPKNLKIGDIRIRYEKVAPGPVTIIAAQKGKSFVPYQMKQGEIKEFRTGSMTADQVLGEARKSNAAMGWVLRLAGFLAMFIGLAMMFKPISVVLDVIPFLGNLAGKGATLISFLLAAGFALFTIAIAWFFYRPLLSIGLIVLGVGLVFGVKFLKEKQGAKTRPPAPPRRSPPPPPGG